MTILFRGRMMSMVCLFIVASMGNRQHTMSRVDAFAPSTQWYYHSPRFTTSTKRRVVTAAASDDDAEWFQQKRGESDMNFIQRLTSQAPPPPSANKAATTHPPTKGYQRIEDWEAEQEASRKNGTMTWEQRVQFEGLRNGNQIRQNDILMRQINSGL